MDSEPVSTTTSPPPKPFPLLTLILSIFVFLSLSSTTYLAYQNMQLTSQIAELSKRVPSSTPTLLTPTPEAISAPNITLKNGLYTDETHKFSFYFPTFWSGEANCEGISSSEEYFCLSSPDLIVSPANFIEKGGRILIVTKSDGSLGVGYTPEEFCSSTKRESEINCEQAKINNQIEIKAIFPSFADNFEDVGIVQNGKITTTIRAEFNKASKENALNTLNQILSSFKFVEPIITPTGTTYTCPANGYVDCMPIMDAAKQKACSADAMTWYKANCPNFKGGAL